MSAPWSILFRESRQTREELEAARELAAVAPIRSQVEPGSLVVARYSALPHYRELWADLSTFGSRLVNAPEQHERIARLEYAEDLGELTFKTWGDFQEIPLAERGGAFVVKGKTNSKKFEWASKMFAPDFASAVRVGAELRMDSMIGEQGLAIRRFEELEIFETGVSGTPMANEWRLFFLGEELLASGFYWSILEDMSKAEAARPGFESRGVEFARECARRLAPTMEFFALDIARKANGDWIAVEVNDGQQAGLNGSVDPRELYRNLGLALGRRPDLFPKPGAGRRAGPGR